MFHKHTYYHFTFWYRILQDHTSSSGIQGQALDSLKDKLSEAEEKIRQEQISAEKVQVRQNKNEILVTVKATYEFYFTINRKKHSYWLLVKDADFN